MAAARRADAVVERPEASRRDGRLLAGALAAAMGVGGAAALCRLRHR